MAQQWLKWLRPSPLNPRRSGPREGTSTAQRKHPPRQVAELHAQFSLLLSRGVRPGECVVATKAANIGLTLLNWLSGRHIVEFEQMGRDRAAYGERLLPTLAQKLNSAGLTRVDTRELRRFRLLFILYPQIREAVSPELLTHAGVWELQPKANQCELGYGA